MLKQVKEKVRDSFRRDPWILAKFVFVTSILGAIGKTILTASIELGGVRPIVAQFIPMLPMMGLTFLAHKYIWRHKHTSLRSHIGGHWSKVYAVEFVVGHSFFIFFAIHLGWKYLIVSIIIGIATGVVTFIYNEWRVFAKKDENKETDKA